MPKIYMVRHGKAAAGWDADRDPGLDDTGWQQAHAVAGELVQGIERPLATLSSPLRRCRETAEPLAGTWGGPLVIEPRVAEVPSPIEDLQVRTDWLREVMAGTWEELFAHPKSLDADHSVDFRAWRQGVVDAVKNLKEDTVIFSHFIAINVVVGAALGDDRVVVFRPDNCSVTVFDTDGGGLSVVSQGREAETTVN